MRVLPGLLYIMGVYSKATEKDKGFFSVSKYCYLKMKLCSNGFTGASCENEGWTQSSVSGDRAAAGLARGWLGPLCLSNASRGVFCPEQHQDPEDKSE